MSSWLRDTRLVNKPNTQIPQLNLLVQISADVSAFLREPQEVRTLKFLKQRLRDVRGEIPEALDLSFCERKAGHFNVLVTDQT